MKARRRTALVAAVVCVFVLAQPAADAETAPKTYRLGWFGSYSCDPAQRMRFPMNVAFFARLAELGYVEGENLVMECRSAEGKPERFPSVVQELLAARVDVLYSPICGAAVEAARQATKSVPIVVGVCSDDMVTTGLVQSLARPGGNITGVQKLVPGLSAKQLEVLKSIVPRASRVAVLSDPSYSRFVADWPNLRKAAEALGVTLIPLEGRNPKDYEAAFEAAVKARADAILTTPDPWVLVYAKQFAELAERYRLPVVYPYHENVDAGGLICYGANLSDLTRRAAEYVDRIFKGADPARLPVQQPTQFELVVNLETAKALGITVPQSILVRADRVIE